MRRKASHRGKKHHKYGIDIRRRRMFQELMKSHSLNTSESTIENSTSNTRIIIYQSEFEYIARCILDRSNIETGGQLFGHWTADGTPIILYALGPGPKANHQSTFFQQDLDYLVKFCNCLRYDVGLHHIVEWHSHHQLGLDHPSGYDIQTMTSSIRKENLGHFLLCIGTCKGNAATARGFLCDCNRCKDANWDVISTESPVRPLIDQALAGMLIHPSKRSKSSPNKHNREYNG